MPAHAETSRLDDFQHFVARQVKGDFQFPQHYIVIDAFFCFCRWPFFFAPLLNDQAIKKNRQLRIGAILPGRIVIFFQPIADLLPGDVVISQLKDRNHFRIIHIEGIANAA